MASRILIVDDDQAECELLSDALTAQGFDAEWELSGPAAVERLERGTFAAVVTDLKMPGMTGIELCQRAETVAPGVPVIVVTAFGSVETAVTAMRAGAYDFVTKPFDLDAVGLVVRRATDHAALRLEVETLRSLQSRPSNGRGLVGTSPAIRDVQEMIDRIAGSDVTVLITGESGTGKELAARELHDRSPRRDEPFVAVNCAAVPEPLLESELFGHVRGAFTDAKGSRAGLLVEARNGTLFLDELGDMPIALQPKLLRALQERTVRPIGGAREIPFQARIVAATNRDLESAVEQGRFREDLYYRVNVVHIELPPLRGRAGDVLLLARDLMERAAQRAGTPVEGFSPEAAERLMAYDWPGNVRELANCVERAVALTRTGRIEADDLPRKVREYRASHVIVAGHDPAELVPLEVVEKRYVLRVLEACRGNKSQAASVLRVSRKTLYRRLEAWGVEEAERDN